MKRWNRLFTALYVVSDAALASLALEHGATLCTADRDFRRFQGLRLVDPTVRAHG